MKKLIMALAAIALAAGAQAASVNWMAGKVYAPGKDGVIGAVNADTGKFVFGAVAGDSFAVKMYVWESLTAQTFKDGDLFAKYTDDKLTGAIVGAYDSSKSTAVATGTLAPENNGDNVYANVLFVLEDKESGEALWYMENTAVKASGAQVQNMNALAMYEAGNTKGAAMQWTAVPEPTSGLLMLVGLAGLALRRRRA